MKEKKFKRCLSCGEQIYGDTAMHSPCITKVFDTQYIPGVTFSMTDPGDHPDVEKPGPPGETFSISHLQSSLPLTLNKAQKELEAGGRKPGYTLKFPVESIDGLPRNQNLCMTIASRMRVMVPPHSLLKLQDDTMALLVKRYGRWEDGKKAGIKTFAQILDNGDIHSTSLDEMGDKLRRVSEIPGLDTQLFLEMILFSFLIGHSDLHLKKFAVRHDERKRNVRLAPMDDLAATKLFRPDEDDFAIPMMGKTTGITGSDFREFAEFLKIHPKAYERMFLRFFRGKRLIGKRINQSVLETDEKIKFSDIVNERFTRLLQ
ncbi:MAG: type II toxin-antitoxin system HipA family toxin [bacterium]|nr:type II toxin-antitoxin system HipA family toxin [bacterium]